MDNKRNAFILACLTAFALLSLQVSAADPILGTTPSNGTASTNITCNILDVSTLYHYDQGSQVYRYMPTYEYTFRGDVVHFWAKISANAVYYLEKANVTVWLTLNSTEARQVQLIYSTGMGAAYNQATGMYEGEFNGDIIIPNASLMPSGNWQVTITSAFNGQTCANDLLSSIKYENVNDVLVLDSASILVGISPNAALSFPNMVPGQFNTAANDGSRNVVVSSPVDREGQGVLGNLSIAVSDYVGTCVIGNVTDRIYANNIRMSPTGFTPWVFLQQNAMPLTLGSTFTNLAGDISTNGGSYSTPVHFQLFYDLIHCATTYAGGQMGVRYQVY